jgi:hypothetical protein
VAAAAIQKQKVTGDLDLEDLRRELDLHLGISWRPVFHIKTTPCRNLILPEGEWKCLDELPQQTSSDLVLWLNRDELSISGMIRYDKRISDSRLSGSLGDRFQLILQEVILDPNKKLYELRHLFEANTVGAEELDLDKHFNFSL